MNGLSILMFIFAFLIFIAGLWIYTGHRSELLLWKADFYKTATDEQIKAVGKWTMIVSIIPIIIALIALFTGIE